MHGRDWITSVDLAKLRRLPVLPTGSPVQLPRLLDELVAAKVDVVYAVNYRVAAACKTGTTLPMVMVSMPDAMFVVDDRLTAINRKVIFDFAVANRLPAMYELDYLVRTGGLVSYGPDLDESLDRAAALIERILKGAKPQDLPFERPTRFRLAINQKAAKAIGLAVPPSLLAQADDVVE